MSKTSSAPGGRESLPHPATRTRARVRRAVALSTALTLTASACATAGSTFGSGVGDTLLERPPYYAGALRPDEPPGQVGHLPVAYQRGASQPDFFDPEGSPGMEDLVTAMTAFLDSLALSVRLLGEGTISTRPVDGEARPTDDGGPASTAGHEPRGTPPDVRFGCTTESGWPDDDCAERDDDAALGRDGQTMHLSVGRPSAEWVASVDALAADRGVDAVLVVTLEVGQYLVRQRGWRGSKEVDLGIEHTQDLPWLTSLETPVSVLQLTGALVGRDGKALRIGAEGLLAHRTSMRMAALGAQELVTDEDVDLLRTARRTDLPGEPLVWQVGLRTLVESLLGRG